MATEQKFLPHMAIHLNKGCPQNSSCTKHLGALFEDWEKVISSRSHKKVTRFIKNHGYPMKLWTVEAQNVSAITFDSRCKQHRKKEGTIYEAITFTKDIRAIDKEQKLLPNKAIANFNGKYKSFIIPRNTIPYQMTNNTLEMIQDEKGVFYRLSISPNHISLDFEISGNQEIKSIECSKKLEEYFKKTTSSNLYLDVFCKSIWNKDTKKFNEVIFGWSC